MATHLNLSFGKDKFPGLSDGPCRRTADGHGLSPYGASRSFAPLWPPREGRLFCDGSRQTEKASK